jgi:hypothetical protein
MADKFGRDTFEQMYAESQIVVIEDIDTAIAQLNLLKEMVQNKGTSTFTIIEQIDVVKTAVYGVLDRTSFLKACIHKAIEIASPRAWGK